MPDELRAAVAARLADDIVKARGGHAYVGVLGARYVLPVLTATGHHDVAFALATQTTEPSWGYWTDDAGFTALGEHWPADTRSRNHHFFGAIVQWLYEDLAGIRPARAGYGRIEFKPQIPASGLDRVSASYESVRGTIATSWRRTASGLELDVTVPRGRDRHGLRAGAERARRDRGRRGPGDRGRERRLRALTSAWRAAASSTRSARAATSSGSRAGSWERSRRRRAPASGRARWGS